MAGSSRQPAEPRSLRRAGPGWALVWVVLLAVGCGESAPPTYPASGTVTFNGDPVEDGTITFLPVQGTHGSNITAAITQGAYATPQDAGLAVGSYRVEIDGFRKTGRQVRDLASPDRRLAEPPLIEERVMYLPPKFNTQSELKVDVGGAADIVKLDFPLRD